MCEWRRTRLFSLPYILVKGFQFYVQLFALWPKVVSEKKRQVAALVQTATFAHPKEKKLFNNPCKVLDEDD